MRTQIVVLTVITIAVAFGAAVMPAMAAEGESTGSFSLGNAQPTVAVELYNLEHETPVSAMDPTTEYAVKIVAGDTNTMNNLRLITVVITKSGHTGANDVQEQATYTWTSTSGGAVGTWALVGPTDTTWTLETGNCVEPGGGCMHDTTGTWYLNFKPAKTAEEGSWGINVTATDQHEECDTASQTGLAMNFYSEIVSIASEFDFGNVKFCSTTDTSISSSVIANGGYLLQSKTNTTWTGDSHSANVVSGTPGREGEICLQNNASDTSGTSNAVGSTYATINGYAGEYYPTSDTGDSKPIYLWLTVSSGGLGSGTYSATYYYQITND